MTDADYQLINWFPQNKASWKRIYREGQPFMWRLKLSRSEYQTLERLLHDSVNENNGLHNHLIEDRDLAMRWALYISEWYRRYYSSTNKSIPNVLNPLSDEAKQIWQVCRFDEAYCYRTSSSSLWLRSLYTLGGVPLRLFINQDNRMTALCEMLQGDDFDPSILGNDDSKVLTWSLQKGGSAYGFVSAVINGTAFSKEDLIDRESIAYIFSDTLKKGWRTATEDKYRISWEITLQPDQGNMGKFMVFNPRTEEPNEEETRGLLYSDRLKKWKFTDADLDGDFEIGIRFYNQGTPIDTDIRWLTEQLRYINKGQGDFAMVGFNLTPTIMAPSEDFDCVKIYCKAADTGKICHIQGGSYPPLLQVWNKECRTQSRWTSIHRRSSTAVILPTEAKVIEPPASCPMPRYKFFYIEDNKVSVSDEKEFYTVTDVMRALHNGKEYVFVSYCNQWQLTVDRYTSEIAYMDGDKVQVTNNNGDIELLPILFGLQSLKLTRTEQGSPFPHQIPATTYRLECRKEGGKEFTECDGLSLQNGIYDFRVNVDGRLLRLRGYFVNCPTDIVKPIERNLANQTVVLLGNQIYKDSQLENRAASVIPVTIGRARIPVYRPIHCRHVVINGILVYDVAFGAKVELPFINLKYVTVQDFDQNGLKEWHGSEYNGDFISKWGGNGLNDSIDSFLHASEELDNNIKIVTFTDSESSNPRVYWNYLEEPKIVGDTSIVHDRAYIEFDGNIENFSGLLSTDKAVSERSAILKNRKKLLDSVYEAFKVGAKYNTYFFPLLPLRMMDKTKVVELIMTPALKENNGNIPPLLMEQLRRMMNEFRISDFGNKMDIAHKEYKNNLHKES